MAATGWRRWALGLARHHIEPREQDENPRVVGQDSSRESRPNRRLRTHGSTL